DLLGLGGQPVLAITARRAETLKARAYDGDIARVLLPTGATLPWILGVADPADDLKTPMKGPLVSEREGSAELHRLALALVKTARLLPAALVLPLSDPAGFAAENALTMLDLKQAAPHLASSPHPYPVVSARLP